MLVKYEVSHASLDCGDRHSLSTGAQGIALGHRGTLYHIGARGQILENNHAVVASNLGLKQLGISGIPQLVGGAGHRGTGASHSAVDHNVGVAAADKGSLGHLTSNHTDRLGGVGDHIAVRSRSLLDHIVAGIQVGQQGRTGTICGNLANLGAILTIDGKLAVGQPVAILVLGVDGQARLDGGGEGQVDVFVGLDEHRHGSQIHGIALGDTSDDR